MMRSIIFSLARVCVCVWHTRRGIRALTAANAHFIPAELVVLQVCSLLFALTVMVAATNKQPHVPRCFWRALGEEAFHKANILRRETVHFLPTLSGDAVPVARIMLAERFPESGKGPHHYIVMVASLCVC